MTAHHPTVMLRVLIFRNVALPKCSITRRGVDGWICYLAGPVRMGISPSWRYAQRERRLLGHA